MSTGRSESGTGAGTSKPTVFISYSHKDEEWKDRLRSHLGVLEQIGELDVWDDRSIDGGAEWFDEIRAAMDRAALAVFLISPDFLRSHFVNNEEVPFLLDRRAREACR